MDALKDDFWKEMGIEERRENRAADLKEIKLLSEIQYRIEQNNRKEMK